MDLASKTWLFSPSRHEREPYNSVEASQCRRFAILYLGDFAQTSDGRAGRGGGGCPGGPSSVSASSCFPSSLYVRHGVCTSCNALAARFAVPDSNGVTLDRDLSAECACVAGVLGHFDLLDLLTKRGTVAATISQKTIFSMNLPLSLWPSLSMFPSP